MNHTESFTFELTADGRRVHVKYPVSQFATIPAYRRLFAEEAHTGQKWNHPHILKYLRFNDQTDDVSIEMEYIPALTLHEALLEEPLGINTVRESRQIMRQLMDAVEYLHEQDVLHLDLRPENILITRSAHDVKVMNPASFYVGQTPSFFIYKERYTAPELFAEGSKPSPAADIYSLGRIMEYLFSYSTLTAGISKVIARATADDPAQRYPTVKEMRKALIRSRKVDRLWLAAKGIAALIVLIFVYQMFSDDRVSTDIVPPTADSTYSRRPHVPPSNQAEDDDLYRLSSMQDQLDGVQRQGLEADTTLRAEGDARLMTESERLFKKEFRRRAEVMIAKVYTPKLMNGDEKQFLKASTEAFTELDRIQREMSEQYGMDVILTTRLSQEVISELTAEYMKKINMPAK
jgi:hypothetical protein